MKGTKIEARIDSGSSDSGIRTTFLTAQQPQETRAGPMEANLAAYGATLKLRGTIDLEVVINGKSYPTSFFVADKLSEEMLLVEKLARSAQCGTLPLCNCLFIGTQQRQQIFTTPGIEKSNEKTTDDILEELSYD